METPFRIDGRVFRKGLDVDLRVDETVAVELESIEGLAPVH